jgi:hypothetical protein
MAFCVNGRRFYTLPGTLPRRLSIDASFPACTSGSSPALDEYTREVVAEVLGYVELGLEDAGECFGTEAGWCSALNSTRSERPAACFRESLRVRYHGFCIGAAAL